MLRRSLWLCLILLVLIPFSFAIPEVLLIDSSSTQLSVIKNQPQLFDIAVFNNGTVPVYNVTLTDVPNAKFSSINFLDVNQSGIINANVTTNSVFSLTTYVTVMRFFYVVPLHQEHKFVGVLVNGSGFIPSNISANQNDTIKFTNVGNETFSVSALDFTFDYDLGVGASQELIFQDAGIIDIFDKNTLLAGKINILNLTVNSFVHDSSFDKAFAISVESKEIPSTLSLDLFHTSFTLNFDEQKISSLEVRNTGSAPLFNVKIFGEWVGVVNDSVVVLNAGESLVTFFTVRPNVTTTNETNLAYQKIISVRADNAIQVDKNISVFVNLHDFSTASASNNGSQVTFTIIPDEYIEQYCFQFPLKCPHTNTTVERFVPRTIYAQLNETQLYEFMNTVPETIRMMDNRQKEDSQTTTDKVSEVQGDVKTIAQTVGEKLQSQDEKLTNVTAALANDNEFYRANLRESERQREVDRSEFVAWAIWFVGAVLFVSALVTAVYFIARKHRENLKNKSW